MRIFVPCLPPVIKHAGMLVTLLSLGAISRAQTDNFDRGNDVGWVRSTNHPATYTFPADVFGGHAYHLQGSPKTTGSDRVARAFSVLTNRMYTNFYAAVDVTSWTTNQDSDQAFGIYSRATNLANIQSGAPSGVTFNVRLNMKRAY